ncbi:hypothetical protein [Jiangella anatolica]|uniref:Uncharacterized protein n=1 Tax=Jiangella anatolica TaxID=2670374 RepID=A0A2W2CT47_9ACTN|nr:hypothetical protein [Jiangella anatolica]PZF83333.1 hypothetical protein C1I92_12875 [Jiangella anatolica]
MTIYSQHPNRGKVQILATYRGSAGTVSSTVTSVDDARVAAPIVDALNRVSACATMPISVFDTRDDRYTQYPSDHLEAVTDRSLRGDLFRGSHSLWYEYVKFLLHEALADLDDAIETVAPPVRTAIAAELETEVRHLRDGLAGHSDGTVPSESEDRRHWESFRPFLIFGGGMDGLSETDRSQLNRCERGATKTRTSNGINDLRLLLAVTAECADGELFMDVAELSVMDDPTVGDPSQLYLSVDAPLPSGLYGRDEWHIDIGRWEPHTDDPNTTTGETVLRCVRSSAPTVDELVELLGTCGERPEQLAVWADTPVGSPLAGTAFVVTKRFDDR